MNKVYIVITGVDYEGTYVWGVFENIENAKKKSKKLNNRKTMIG